MTTEPKPLGIIKILAIAFSGVVLFLILSGSCVMMFLHLFTSHPAYQEALEKIRENPAVIEALGEPIETALIPYGEVTASGDEGRAELRIGIRGPKGRASARLKAILSDGEWELIELKVRLADGRELDLLDHGP
jgi:hypothetical protein